MRGKRKKEGEKRGNRKLQKVSHCLIFCFEKKRKKERMGNEEKREGKKKKEGMENKERIEGERK